MATMDSECKSERKPAAMFKLTARVSLVVSHGGINSRHTGATSNNHLFHIGIGENRALLVDKTTRQ